MNGFMIGFGAIPGFQSGFFLPSEGTDWTGLVLLCLAAAVFSYLCGSVNSAVLVSRGLFGQDIRSFGSGNAGLTNMHRVFGVKGAALTLVGDMLKAVVAILGSMSLVGYLYGGNLALLFCVIGHAFPCFFGFRGGKGVLSAATGICCLSPVVFLVLIALFLLMVLSTKYVSVGSITAAFFYPLMLSAFFGAVPFFMLSTALLTAVLVIYLHRENVRRLIHGEEKKFGQKEPPKAEEDK